jgi:Tfp pilus assembly protein PilN
VEIAVLSLLTYVDEELGIGQVDGVTLHDPDDEPLVAHCADTLELPVKSAPAVAMDEHAASTALAQAGLLPTPGAVDLFADLRPSAGLKENFPVRAAALLVAVLAAGGWMLNEEAVSLERETAHVEKQVAALAKRVRITPADVKVKHVAVEAEWEAATAFLTKRVFWTDFLRAIPEVLPATVVLTDLNGRDKVQFRKKTVGSAASRQLVITGQVTLDGVSSSPPEVSMITDALRESPEFQRDFARVTGANVRLMPGMSGAMARLVFVCLPSN